MRTRLDDAGVRSLLALSIGLQTPDKVAQVIQQYRRDANWALLGYRSNATIVGLVGIERAGEQNAVIRHLSVAPEVRKRGIGKLLIEYLRRGLGLRSLTAETDNDAVGFYRQCGFEIVGLGQSYPGVDRYRCTWNNQHRHEPLAVEPGSEAVEVARRKQLVAVIDAIHISPEATSE